MKRQKKLFLIAILTILVFGMGLTLGFAFAEQPETTVAEEVPSETKTVIELPTQSEKKENERIALGSFEVTAYCPCVKCCGQWADGITYTGTKATEGRTIAVDPDVIPLGSKVEIDGVTYIAEDIGGAVDGNRLDLYFNSHDEALSWGRQYREVFLIEEVSYE